MYWYRHLRDVPRRFSAIVVHEFLDALPIHYFQRSQESGKWAEVCVDINDHSPNHFRFVLSPRFDSFQFPLQNCRPPMSITEKLRLCGPSCRHLFAKTLPTITGK